MATGTQDEIRVEAHGSKGAIRFNLMQPNFLEYYDATLPEGHYGADRGFKHIESVQRYPSPAHYPGPKNTVGWDRFHVASLYEFVKHVAEGKPASPDIAEGAKVQAVLDAAVRSNAEGGRWTPVPAL
jgi:predicted dehydrogenase